MEVIRGREWTRALPAPDGTERPFFEAAARGELCYQRCPECEHGQFYPRPVCTACGASPGWARASGRGVVHTFTVVRQNAMPPFKEELPYVVAMIELEEGVRMMGNVTDCAPEDVHVGLAVEAYAVEYAEGMAVPFWRPA
jgi:uncharacterized OB-fold protein